MRGFGAFRRFWERFEVFEKKFDFHVWIFLVEKSENFHRNEKSLLDFWALKLAQIWKFPSLNVPFHAMKAKFSNFEQNLSILLKLSDSFHLVGILITWKTVPSFLVPLNCSKLKLWKFKCAWNGIFYPFMLSILVFDQKTIFLLDLGSKKTLHWNSIGMKTCAYTFGAFPLLKSEIL